MAAKSLRDLFIEELRDAYDGEKRLLKALPKLAKAATNEELQDAFTTHATETEAQVARLEEVFRAIGEPVRGKKCDGIMGIIEEANSMMEELDEGPILDAALISGAQRAEHYEISAYGTLAHFADILGEQEAKDLLGETLEEEKAADEKLNAIAKSDVNREALMGEGEESEEEESAGRGARGMRRSAESMAMANERTGRGASGGRSARASGRSGRRSGTFGSRGGTRSSKKR